MRIFVDHFLEIISKHPSFQFFKVKIVHYVLSIDEVFHDLFFKNMKTLFLFVFLANFHQFLLLKKIANVGKNYFQVLRSDAQSLSGVWDDNLKNVNQLNLKWSTLTEL